MSKTSVIQAKEIAWICKKYGVAPITAHEFVALPEVRRTSVLDTFERWIRSPAAGGVLTGSPVAAGVFVELVGYQK